MNDRHPSMIQQITGQVRSVFYLVDEPVTTLTLRVDKQLLTVRAFGQLALELRALPRGATICATLSDMQLECAQITCFTLIPS